jgi:UDP-2,3-diacylglucosamine pyrophosphatase LpxH
MKRIVFVVVALTCAALSVAAQSTRHTILISDLHFGVGKEAGGTAWLAMEDFRWSGEFAAFLATISADSGGNTDLVIAGDLFELWQPLTRNCEHPNKNYGCTQAEAVARVQRVLAEHRDDMDALAQFANTGTNSVAIVPGNHDAALFFPAVQQLIKQAVGNAPRILIYTKGYWLSQDKKILAEHGQQIGKDVNRFDRWPDPFVGPGAAHLQKTWGEQFVQSFYNQYEEKYPVIDNLSDNGGIGYGLKAEKLKGIGMAVGKFLRFYLAGSSWAQFAASLGGPGSPPPEWDIDRIRAEGDVFFHQSLPTEDPMYDVAESAYEEGTLGITLGDLSDDEIRSICESRLALYRTQTAAGEPPSITPCASKQPLGAAVQAVFGPARDKLVRARGRELLTRLRGDNTITTPFGLYVYGHTHSAYGPRPIKVDDTWTFTSANTGAWQRIATPAQFKAIECGRAAGDVLRTSLTRLPACYSLIRVKPYAAMPVAELLYWRQNAGTWSLATSCGWTPPACP